MKIDDLIEKYPKIFQQYEGNPGYVNWYGIPEAWVKNIDILCGSIQDYIDYTYKSINNPDYVEGSDLPRFIQEHPVQVTCIQMKEKFGSLRFYINGGDSIVDGMIKMAEYMCDNTCESCGAHKNLGMTKGWLTVLCKKCAKESNRTWEPYNK